MTFSQEIQEKNDKIRESVYQKVAAGERVKITQDWFMNMIVMLRGRGIEIDYDVEDGVYIIWKKEDTNAGSVEEK